MNNFASDHQFYDINDKRWQVSTWSERACLASGCITLLITLTNSIISTPPQPFFRLLFAAFIGYLLADLVTGIYHWSIDNYGGPNTPVFGNQIESFQAHHFQPWAITKQDSAKILYVLSAGVTVAVLPANYVFSRYPAVLMFLCVFFGCVMFCQQFHAWSHTPKGKLPRVVVALQDVGVLVGRADHGKHHQVPFNSNYCIVSGLWNRLLDWSRFFWFLELFIFKVTGLKPRSWVQAS